VKIEAGSEDTLGQDVLSKEWLVIKGHIESFRIAVEES